MSNTNNENVEIWLWLLLVMRPHNPRTITVLRSTGYDVRRACVKMREGEYQFLKPEETERVKTVRLGRIRELQCQCEENGISIIPLDHPDYPEKLRYIKNPPIVLFVQGDIRCLKGRKIISAVGTRTPSEYSLQISEHLCGEIAKSDTAIISGMAVGLDTSAHKAALSAGGITVGILACGNLVNYPVDNKTLKEEIISSGGAVISELLPDSEPSKGYFDLRNRLISGISDCVIVLESAEKSGTLLTAKHAFEQRRRVFFIPPHDIRDKRYCGAAKLYKDGASPVFCTEDILNAFTLTGENTSDTSAESEKPTVENTKAQTSKPNINEAKPQKVKSTSYEQLLPEGLTEAEALVYKALVESAADADTLVMRTDIEYTEIMDTLLSMELDGLVKRNADGTYAAI